MYIIIHVSVEKVAVWKCSFVKTYVWIRVAFKANAYFFTYITSRTGFIDVLVLSK